MEVGLGGRLDATNAWDGGVAAITNVALDHMEYLGTTVTRSPGEGRHHQARRSGRHRRRRRGAGGHPAACRANGRAASGDLAAPGRRDGPPGTTVAHPDLGELRLGLLGRHQAANAAVALGILDALGRRVSGRPIQERCGTGWRPPAGRAPGAARGGDRWAGRPASPARRSGAHPGSTICSSTAPTTRPAPQRWPSPSTTSVATSPGVPRRC